MPYGLTEPEAFKVELANLLLENAQAEETEFGRIYWVRLSLCAQRGRFVSWQQDEFGHLSNLRLEED